jgi:hypothetical protein
MFGLNFEDDIEQRILDCGAGGASFVSEWCDRGGSALACDPMYALPLEEQAELVRNGVERAAANVVAEPDRYVWKTFVNAQVHKSHRESAANRFLSDIEQQPQRYVPGSLPDLPFTSDAFDLVLSSHLLFVYSRTISFEEHVEYLREMFRVAPEVRLFPLVGFEGDAAPLVRSVCAVLEAEGAAVEVRGVSYEFFRGASEYLCIRRPANRH